MRFTPLAVPALGALFTSTALAQSIGLADIVDEAGGGITGNCVAIPYCHLSVSGVPGCAMGESKIGGPCNSLITAPPPNPTYDLDSVQDCEGYKWGMESTDGNLWVYIWNGAGEVRGVGIFDRCDQAHTSGRTCSVEGGGCHQLGTP